MDSILKKFISYLPKPLIKNLYKCIHSASESDSLAICFLLCVCKRILILLICLLLVIYTVFVYCLGYLCGPWLRKFRIVPFDTYQQTNFQEDPGVTEMHALLRGEDCFDHNLNQGQRRPSLPVDFNPYNEMYLAILYTKLIDIIIRLVVSVKQHDSVFSQVLNGLFTWFDYKVVGYLTSLVAVNKRI